MSTMTEIYNVNDRILMRSAQILDESGDEYTSQNLADLMALAIIDEVCAQVAGKMSAETLVEGLSSVLADLMYMVSEGDPGLEVVKPRH